jgi:hypothetical protein
MRGALRGSKRPASSTVATDQYKCDDIGDAETYELVLLHLGATVAFAKGLVMPLFELTQEVTNALEGIMVTVRRAFDDQVDGSDDGEDREERWRDRGDDVVSGERHHDFRWVQNRGLVLRA